MAVNQRIGQILINTFGVVFAGNFDFGPAVLAGLVGGLAMLAVVYTGRAMGMTATGARGDKESKG